MEISIDLVDDDGIMLVIDTDLGEFTAIFTPDGLIRYVIETTGGTKREILGVLRAEVTDEQAGRETP